MSSEWGSSKKELWPSLCWRGISANLSVVSVENYEKLGQDCDLQAETWNP